MQKSTHPAKIVHIIRSLPVGGVESLLAHILPLLPKERYIAHVICTESMGINADILRDAGVTVELVPVLKRLHPIGLMRLAYHLRKLQPQIVHSHMFASNTTATIAAHLGVRKTPVVCHVHMLHEWHSPSRIRMELLLNRWRKKYIVVSNDCKDNMLQNLKGISEDKIAVLYNSAGTMVAPTKSRDVMRKEMGIEPNETVIGMVARLDWEKGVDVLFQSFLKLRQAHQGIKLLIVGGNDIDNYKQMAQELGISQQVIFAGEQIQVSNYYSAMDIFTLPSRRESFGLVLIEAMQFGLPIVATNVGGIPEVVMNGQEGLLVPSEDAVKLAGAIEGLITNRELAEQLGQNGRIRAKVFAPEIYVDRLCKIYDSILMTHF